MIAMAPSQHHRPSEFRVVNSLPELCLQGMPELMLFTQFRRLPLFPLLEPPNLTRKTAHRAVLRVALWLRSAPANYSRPIGAGVVQRFSPIHF